ncbi:MAG TPA: MotA/TolQ/ExbB proton channel family protein [Syntrophomonas sp.]|nr:MotA/TolQ/ExbB proton channel family protein [Syntrophomonas sp.]
MEFWLGNTLHIIGQSIKIPCMIAVFLLIIITIWQIGDLLVELLTERRKKCADIPALIKTIHQGGLSLLPKVIEDSALTRRQKEALQMLLDSRYIPQASLTALAQKLLAAEEGRYEKATAVTDVVIKLGPMFGLLGTLIPLGPGIVALGKGDTATLSTSLNIAFDSTISGLATAAICYVISNIRKRWYEEYLNGFEAVMECVLEEVAQDAQKQDYKRQAQVALTSR